MPNPMSHLIGQMPPPPPPPPFHHYAHHQPHNVQQHHGSSPPIPLAMIARINADDMDNQLQLQEQQQIEEHIIPIFQQLLPELRQGPDMMREHKQQQEAEDRAAAAGVMMPNKVLYHPALAEEGRQLYTVAISDKQMPPNDGATVMMHQEAVPSETARHNVAAAPMFQRVPINVPVSMMIQPQIPSSSIPQENPIDDPKPDHRPHCKFSTILLSIHYGQPLRDQSIFFSNEINFTRTRSIDAKYTALTYKRWRT